MKRFLTVLFLFTNLALVGRAGSSLTVLIQTDTGADVGKISNALGGTIIDTTGGGTYPMSIPTWPSTLPAGVISIEADAGTYLPAIRSAILKVTNTPSDWYKSQPSLQLINLPQA